MPMTAKFYLGDGVSVELDPEAGALILTTSDGRTTTNRIVLEQEVWSALMDYVQKLEQPTADGD